MSKTITCNFCEESWDTEMIFRKEVRVIESRDECTHICADCIRRFSDEKGAEE